MTIILSLIKKSFKTVADEYGFTEENAPRFTAFATTDERLYWHMDGEHRPMYVFEVDGVLCGYYSLQDLESLPGEDRNLCGSGQARQLVKMRLSM